MIIEDIIFKGYYDIISKAIKLFLYSCALKDAMCYTNFIIPHVI